MPATFDGGLFFIMLKYLYKSKNESYKLTFIATLIVIVIVSILDILQGFLFMIFMNRALKINQYPIWILVLIGISFAFIYYIFSLLSSYLITVLLKKIRRGLINDSLSKYLDYSTSYFLKKKVHLQLLVL